MIVLYLDSTLLISQKLSLTTGVMPELIDLIEEVGGKVYVPELQVLESAHHLATDIVHEFEKAKKQMGQLESLVIGSVRLPKSEDLKELASMLQTHFEETARRTNITVIPTTTDGVEKLVEGLIRYARRAGKDPRDVASKDTLMLTSVAKHLSEINPTHAIIVTEDSALRQDHVRSALADVGATILELHTLDATRELLKGHLNSKQRKAREQFAAQIRVFVSSQREKIERLLQPYKFPLSEIRVGLNFDPLSLLAARLDAIDNDVSWSWEEPAGSPQRRCRVTFKITALLDVEGIERIPFIERSASVGEAFSYSSENIPSILGAIGQLGSPGNRTVRSVRVPARVSATLISRDGAFVDIVGERLDSIGDPLMRMAMAGLL